MKCPSSTQNSWHNTRTAAPHLGIDEVALLYFQLFFSAVANKTFSGTV
jgi:hypothetical protein